MGPAGLFLDQNGIKDQSAVIIQRSDEIPFLFRSRCPEMMRGVMLNQFSDITGQDLSVMESSLEFLQIEAMLLGPINDRRQRDLLMICSS